MFWRGKLKIRDRYRVLAQVLKLPALLDKDRGVSRSGAVAISGVARLTAEVALRQVGLVLSDLPFTSASEALPLLLDTALRIQAPEGLQPS